VLVESSAEGRPGCVRGTACRYAPVEMPAEMGRPGQLVRVRAGKTDGQRIEAAPADAVV